MIHCVTFVLLYIFKLCVNIFGSANCSFVALGNNFYLYVKALFFHHCLCLLYMVLLLKLDFMMSLDLLLLPVFVTEINRIYIHHINMIYFLMVLVWFLFQVMDSAISSAFADLPEVIDLKTLHALLSIGQASSWRMAGITISTCGHFGKCLWFFFILSVSLFCCFYFVKIFCFT